MYGKQGAFLKSDGGLYEEEGYVARGVGGEWGWTAVAIPTSLC